MSSWIIDPELFLYTKENDAYLWRCKKTSRVPMITDDFDDLGKVTDHLDLVGDMFEWERADYDALVAYISPRRLLVNGQGLVSTELYISGQDGNLNRSQLLCCYIRSLDVLNMKTYIPNLRERLIPSRTVQYLEEDGRAARVLVDGSSSGSSTLPKEIIIKLRDDASKEKSAKEALEKETSDLKTANETLKGSITKLTVDLAARSSEVDALKEKVDDLEAMNKVLESIIATLITDQAACTNEVATLQQVLEQVKNESVRKMAALEAKNEALEDDVTELTANLAAQVNELNTSLQQLSGVKSDNLAPMRQAVDLQDEVDSPVWMNGLTNRDWVGIEDLEDVTDAVGSMTCTELPRGTFRFDDTTTNVRTSYFYSYQIDDDEGCRVVAFEELSPNEEKARFNPDFWCWVHYGEVVRICSRISVLPDTDERICSRISVSSETEESEEDSPTLRRLRSRTSVSPETESEEDSPTLRRLRSRTSLSPETESEEDSPTLRRLHSRTRVSPETEESEEDSPTLRRLRSRTRVSPETEESEEDSPTLRRLRSRTGVSPETEESEEDLPTLRRLRSRTRVSRLRSRTRVSPETEESEEDSPTLRRLRSRTRVSPETKESDEDSPTLRRLRSRTSVLSESDTEDAEEELLATCN